MPLKWFHCDICDSEIRTFDPDPICTHGGDTSRPPRDMTELLVAPKTKFMEKQDDFRGKSRLRDQEKILRKRAREYSRENEMHELIANNPKEEAVKNGWVNREGVKRKKIDDL